VTRPRDEALPSNKGLLIVVLCKARLAVTGLEDLTITSWARTPSKRRHLVGIPTDRARPSRPGRHCVLWPSKGSWECCTEQHRQPKKRRGEQLLLPDEERDLSRQVAEEPSTAGRPGRHWWWESIL